MKSILFIMAISFSASFAAALTCDLDEVCAEYGYSVETCRSMPFCKVETSRGGCYPVGPNPTGSCAAFGGDSREQCERADQIERAINPEKGCEWRGREQYCRAKVRF